MRDSYPHSIVLRTWHIFSSVHSCRNFPMILSLGRKLYDDMLLRNRLYLKKELRNKLVSGDAH